MPISIAFEVPPVPTHGDPPGDPLSTVKFGAFGDKGGNGIGEEGYRGIGDGLDGPPGLVARSRPGHLVSLPQLIFKVEPEFSEEARKAKYSGVVVLQIEVDTNGKGALISRGPKSWSRSRQESNRRRYAMAIQAGISGRQASGHSGYSRSQFPATLADANSSIDCGRVPGSCWNQSAVLHPQSTDCLDHAPGQLG